MFNGGFGIDKALLKEIISSNDKLLKKIEGIIIFYDGVKEKKYFYADLDTWFENAEDYSTTKEKDNRVESYGEQKILRGNFFTVLGLHPDDYEAQKQLL